MPQRSGKWRRGLVTGVAFVLALSATLAKARAEDSPGDDFVDQPVGPMLPSPTYLTESEVYYPAVNDAITDPSDSKAAEQLTASESLIRDSQIEPAQYALYPGAQCARGPATIQWATGPYFRVGPSFVLGDGIFEKQDTGYAIIGGVRQPLGPAFPGDKAFLDLGISYLSAFGERTLTVPGQELNDSVPVDDIDVDATLHEIRRSSAHIALGTFLGSPLDNRSQDPQMRLGLEFGGRIGHLHGRFLETTSADIADGNTFAGSYSSNDTFAGLFVTTEAVLLRRNSVFGDLQWTVAGEFGHDWVQFEGFRSSGLGTASVLFGFLLTR